MKQTIMQLLVYFSFIKATRDQKLLAFDFRHATANTVITLFPRIFIHGNMKNIFAK